MNPTLSLIRKNRDTVLSVAELLYGDGAWEITKALTQDRKDNLARGVAIAGTATGAALGVSEIGEGLRDVGKTGGVLRKVGAVVPKMPGGPKTKLAVAGTMLGSDLLATKELKKPKQPPAATLTKIPKPPSPVISKSRVQQAKDEIDDGGDVLWRGEISKMDTDKRQVFGWASIVEVNGEPVIDLQGDLMTIETIEKAAYDYVRTSRKGGNQHQRNGAEPHHVSDMIESFIVTDEKKQQMGLPADTPTGWWVGFAINDDKTWEQVKNGERREFSIHGSGTRKSIDL